MATANLEKVNTRELTTSNVLMMEAAETAPEYAPGRVNSGRQASFDAVSAWNAVGAID